MLTFVGALSGQGRKNKWADVPFSLGASAWTGSLWFGPHTDSAQTAPALEQADRPCSMVPTPIPGHLPSRTRRRQRRRDRWEPAGPGDRLAEAAPVGPGRSSPPPPPEPSAPRATERGQASTKTASAARQAAGCFSQRRRRRPAWSTAPLAQSANWPGHCWHFRGSSPAPASLGCARLAGVG